MKKLAVLTAGMWRIDTLPALLDDAELKMCRHPAPGSVDGVLAWGRKPSAKVAEDFAMRNGLPLLRIEDGFFAIYWFKQKPPSAFVGVG